MSDPRTRSQRPEPLAAKVPEVTVVFWVVKLLTTGMGEAASDYLGSVNIALAAVVGLGGFVVALRWQLRAPAYSAVTYWFAVAMVAVFGTMAADGLHVVLQAPYWLTSLAWAVVVAVLFVRWRRSEGTLSIHSITTCRRERFYWATVFATFALGTALGDLTAASLSLGYLGSVAVFGAAIVVPLVAWRFFGLGAIGAFWSAYVLTRPLGASVADWLAKPRHLSGVDLGDGPVAGVAVLMIAGAVVWLARTGLDRQRPEPARVTESLPALD